MLTTQFQQQSAQLLHTFKVLLLCDIQNGCHSKHIIDIAFIIINITAICIHLTLLNHTSNIVLTYYDISKFRQVYMSFQKQLL
ncbi:hypothetical protein L798_12828 [Zootermopsis nevadensis]|uniref:Uncharacterized protein n=1 Tax=Zootermopsis nevadensis TaxID=136037 RepID=A0A067RI66_ZOONE|nr:hypothetical protein L798_12828 [Zootermopsis nevadensis]